MTILQTIYHKRNELFEVELYKDEECTEAFDFTNVKDLYIERVNGDITSLVRLRNQAATWQNIYTPYLCEQFKYYEPLDKIKTLNDITPNLSKYIPEDNAVLFLDGEKISLIDYDNYYDMFSGYRDIEFEGKIIKGMPYHPQIYGIHTIGDRVSVHKHEHGIDDYTNFTLNILKGKKLTIFLPHGTQSELQKANEVGKYLWENFGIKPDVFVLHCFLTKIVYGTVGYLCDKKKYMLSIKNKCFMDDIYCKDTSKLSRLNKDYDKEFIYYELDTLNGEFAEYINKIITTNSTGILKPEDSNERLQIIDVKEIFEECGEIVKNNP